MQPDFSVVIPARYASQRLPGKPLALIAGRPMIEHVYLRAMQSGAAQVVIATDDQRVYDAASLFCESVVLTSSAHNSGTERIAEVATRLSWPDDMLIVNLQGDEPLMPPGLLGQVAAALAASDAGMATLAVALNHPDQLFDPNIVKVVLDHRGQALYFSRATIPWQRDRFADGESPAMGWCEGMLRHLGIYAYRVGFLRQYVHLAVSPLEGMESLEQLRVLWHGLAIAVAVAAEAPPPGVDTAEDLAKVDALLSAAMG